MSVIDHGTLGVSQGFTPMPGRLIMGGVDIEARLAELEAWKQAVIDALVVNHSLKPEHESNPRQAVADLIAIECQMALDPLISLQAKAKAATPAHVSLREEWELKYSRKQGHAVRSALLFHRGLGGRYSNPALQRAWLNYKRKHEQAAGA